MSKRFINLKKGKKYDAANYRPVSLTDWLSLKPGLG